MSDIEMHTITSQQNPRIKEVIKLNKRARRDARRCTIVEGIREISRALECGTLPLECYICPELITTPEAQKLYQTLTQLAHEKQTQLHTVPPKLFAKMAYRGESGGLLLVIPYLQKKLNDLQLGKSPFIAVVENVEKPGNLGAILRTADGAGVDALLVCGDQGHTDIHNPNVVRASLGTLFSVSVIETTTSEALNWLQDKKIQVTATTPDTTTLYTAVDFTQPTAIVMGSEADGLSSVWLEAAHTKVQIPMLGIADSLNLSTATALLLYEVVRQRGAK